MSSTKMINNKRRNHAAKILHQIRKRIDAEHSNSGPESTSSSKESKRNQVSPLTALRNQYALIGQDIRKLQVDLNQTYDLARRYVGQFRPVDVVKDILKSR
jgi:hypothetical protein